MTENLIFYIKKHQEVTKLLNQDHWQKDINRQLVENGFLELGKDVNSEDIDPKYSSPKYQFKVNQKIGLDFKIVEEIDKSFKDLLDDRKHCQDCRFYKGQVRSGHCGAKEVYDSERLIRCTSFMIKNEEDPYSYERTTDEYQSTVRSLLRSYCSFSLVDPDYAKVSIHRAVKQREESKGELYGSTLLGDLRYQWVKGNKGDIDGLWFD